MGRYFKVKQFGKSALLALAAVGLGACSSTPDDGPLQCPEVSILAEGASLTRYAANASNDITNIIHEESMDGFQGLCEENLDDGLLVMEITPRVISKRGPANTDGKARFEYFVALTDANGKLINKQRFPVVLTYPGDASGALWKDEIPVTLKLPLKNSELATKWRVFIGLQLSREDLRRSQQKNP